MRFEPLGSLSVVIALACVGAGLAAETPAAKKPSSGDLVFEHKLDDSPPPLRLQPQDKGFGRVETKTGTAFPSAADRQAAFARAMGGLHRAIARAQTVEVFEGIPRQHEKEAFAAAREKPLYKISDQEFYLPPQVVPEWKRRALDALATGPALAPFAGFKLCGGFHADYAVRWTWNDGKSACYLLLCFGCQDARVLSAENERTDISIKDAATLREFFAAFRKERPETAKVSAP